MSLTLKNICKILDNPIISPNAYKHVLEFGTWKGDSMETIRNNISNVFKIYGFDSFKGLPEDWPETVYKKGAFDLGGEIPEKLKKLDIKIFPGWFKDTIPEYIKEADDIALLHIDCDIYSSTIDILYSDIKNYIKAGTYIVFDEWHYCQIVNGSSNIDDIVYKTEDALHEQKAFKEWTKDYNIKYKLLKTIEPFRQAIEIL